MQQGSGGPNTEKAQKSITRQALLLNSWAKMTNGIASEIYGVETRTRQRYQEDKTSRKLLERPATERGL
jgi:hypothetical protein